MFVSDSFLALNFADAGKISTEVAGVMNKVISLRIADNNKLLDATLTARLPDYARNTDRRFVLVRPDDTSTAVVVPAGPNDTQDDLLHKARTATGDSEGRSVSVNSAAADGKSGATQSATPFMDSISWTPPTVC